jgi:hypothetical protein
MADGTGGSVGWTEPGYDEPDRATGNRMNTDYDGPARIKSGFKDRRVMPGNPDTPTASQLSARAMTVSAYRSGPV